ncbi:zinc knuckle CX2CX4HX4C containing protein [Tanacetum coccineum]
MVISLRRSRRRVKRPNKFGYTVRTFHGRSNDNLVDPDEGELQTNNTDERITVDDSNDGADGDKLDKPDMNVSKHCNVNEVLNEMHIPVNPSPMQEFVIFDEEIVNEGSKKWEMSAWGYFVGYRMSIQELRYRLYIMWSKFGLKHILNNGNGVFVFKFDNKQDRTEQETLPLWVKIMSPPLEAWSKKGLSALASKIRTPLIMDVMTTRMCAQGVGSLGYARVLVEANAKKGLDDNIDVLYKNKTNDEKFVKKENDNDAEGFTKVGNRKEKYNEGRKQYVNKFAEKKYGNQKIVYRKKINIVVDKEYVSSEKCTNQESFNTSMLQDLEEEHLIIKLSNKEIDEVEKYPMMDLQPLVIATNKWSKEMIECFKEKRKEQYRKKKSHVVEDTNYEIDIELDENDVFIDRSGTAKFMTDNKVS